jgi:acetyl-CoA carboxylase beta subunit
MIGLYNYNGKFEILYSFNILKQKIHNKKLHDIIIDSYFIPQFKLEYNQTKCSICIEEFLKKNILTSLVIILKCKHIFHINCFDKYVKTLILNENIDELYIRCPLCNDNINKLDFLCCYKKMLEKIYNKTNNKRVILVVKKTTRIKFIKKMNK